MSACTFFGHSDCFDLDTAVLRSVIEDVINQGVDTFYVGNQGRFDACVRGVLRQLQAEYPHIRYAVVLAYMPTVRTCDDFSDTMFPEGLENVHPRYAIQRRNRWMLQHADVVVCYVRHSWGGAAQMVKSARSQGKQVIELED